MNAVDEMRRYDRKERPQGKTARKNRMYEDTLTDK